GYREVEVRAGNRVGRAEHLRQLVGPARVPDEAIDRGMHLVLVACQVCELARSRLEHLGDAIEDLAAVVSSHVGPLRLCAGGDANGVANVLSRSPRNVLPFGLVRAPRLRPREGAADEQLVGLLDRKAAAAISP